MAVALPVDLFLQRAFEVANEVELPETWLDAPPGMWKLLLGTDYHHGWRLADPAVRIRGFVLWLVRERRDGYITAVLHLLRWLLRQLKREPEPPSVGDDAASSLAASGSGSRSGALVAQARIAALGKRAYAAAGLAGVYFVWAIFSWFIFVRAPRLRCCLYADAY